jgi:hypothetical protein
MKDNMVTTGEGMKDIIGEYYPWPIDAEVER